MTDKQINKWLRKEFRPIGWILIFYYILMNLLVSLEAVADLARQMLWNVSTGNFPFDVNVDALMDNAWGYILCIFLGIILLHAWKGPDYWQEEIFRREERMRPSVFFCALILCMGSQMVNSLWLTGLELVMNLFGSSMMPMLEMVSGSTGSFSMFLYGAVLAPISEELLFRGYILRALRPYGKRFAILGSAILFGLFHGNLLQGPYAVLVGLVMGWLTCTYSIHWAIALHVFNNLVLAEGLGRLAEVLPVALSDGLSLLLFGGGLAASGVILRKKRGEIAAYRAQEWIDRRCIKCLLTNSGFIVFALFMCVSMVLWMLA